MEKTITRENNKLRKDYPMIFIILTPVQFSIASKMYDSRDDIVLTGEMFECLGRSDTFQNNNIATHVKTIRAKFLKNKIPFVIETYRSKGYMMR